MCCWNSFEVPRCLGFCFWSWDPNIFNLVSVDICKYIVLRIFVYRIDSHRLYHDISCNLSIYNKVFVVLFKIDGLFKCLSLSYFNRVSEPTERQPFTMLYLVNPLSFDEKFMDNCFIALICLPYTAVTLSDTSFWISPVTTGLPPPSTA